jgi:hypothetical protein
VTNRNEFERFLGFAEAWLDWGESYIPHGRKKEGPTLPPEETWCFPDETPLSEGYTVIPPPLPSRYEKYHKGYRV